MGSNVTLLSRYGSNVTLLSLSAGPAVVIAVGGPLAPGGRDELHRADRAVHGRVAVDGAAVSVRDRADAGRAVQRHPDDRRGRAAVLPQPGAAVLPVVGLHPADA